MSAPGSAAPTAGRSARAAAWSTRVLLVGAALTALAVVGGTGTRLAVITAAQLLGVVGVLAAVRAHRPARPAVWWWLAAAAGGYGVAWHALRLGAPGLVVGLLMTAVFVLIGQALVRVTRTADSRPALERVDVALLATSAATASWHVVDALGGTGARATDAWVATQSAGTVVFVAAWVWARVAGRASAPTFRLLLLVGVGLVAWHTATLVAALRGAYTPGSRVDVLLVPAWTALVASAWQPTMRLVGRPAPTSPRRFGGSLAIAAAVVSLGLVPVVAATGTFDLAPWVLGAGTAATVVLLVVREQLVVRGAARLVHTDVLTGLGNRRALVAVLTQRLADPARAPALLCLLDLDGFTDVNDTRGHSAGDDVLREVARRLTDAGGTGSRTFRLGGDEFAVLAPLADRDPAGSGGEASSALVRELLAAVTEPLPIGGPGAPVRLSATAGEVVLPSAAHRGRADAEAADADALAAAASASVGDAELALSAARRSGVPAVRATAALRSRHRRERTLSEGLVAALASRDQLVPHYQPLVSIGPCPDADRTAAHEALVRWQHPTLGALCPDEFLPIAERLGVVAEVDARVLELALADCARWRAAPGWQDLAVSVNASGAALQQADLVDRVLGALAAAGLPGDALVLEITEQSVLDERAELPDRLRELQLRGVRVAVDDFGSGYASLDYLLRFPVDLLKVDRSLVRRLDTASGRRLLGGVVSIAHDLGATVLAEGVEDDAQLATCRQLGFDAVQGVAVARPACAAAVDQQVLLAGRPPAAAAPATGGTGPGGDHGAEVVR